MGGAPGPAPRVSWAVPRVQHLRTEEKSTPELRLFMDPPLQLTCGHQCLVPGGRIGVSLDTISVAILLIYDDHLGAFSGV